MVAAKKHKETRLDTGDKKILFWIVCVSILLYIFTLSGAIGNFNSVHEVSQSDFPGGSHQKSSFVQMLSILEDGDVKISRSAADSAIPDTAYYTGNFYSFFPPGRAITSIPFYIIGSFVNLGVVFAYASVALFGIGTSILLFISMRKIFQSSKETSLFVVFLYSVISFSLVYTTTFMQHTYASFFFMLLLYLIWHFGKSHTNLFMQSSLIWIIYGLTWFYDYSNIFILAPLILYFYIVCVRDEHRYKKIGTKQILFFRTIPMLFLIITLHFAYNLAAHGDMLRLSNTLPQYLQTNYDYLVTASEQVAQSKPAIKAFAFYRIPQGLYTLLLDPTRSIFLFSPIFILIFLVPLIKQKRARIEQNILWISIIGITLMYASFPSPEGGWSFGPRYLIPATLCMSILIGIWFDRLKNNRLVFLTVLILGLYTLLQTLSGTLGLPQVRLGEETMYLGIKNFNYITQGLSRNLMYNELFSKTISLTHYYWIIVSTLAVGYVALLRAQIDHSKKKSH